MELHRMAATEAFKEGHRGAALATRMAEIVDDPTLSPELMKRAKRYAAGLTFQEQQANPQMSRMLGSIKGGLSALDDAKQDALDVVYNKGLSKLGVMGNAVYGLASFPPSVMIAPFINTPFNILKRAAQYTPFGLAAAEGGNRDRMMIAGRGAVGTAMLGAGLGLWWDGRLTGRARGGTQAEKDEWYATKKPYSIKIGDHWVPYQYLGPTGMALGALANYADAVAEDPKNVSGYFGKLMSEAGRVTVDQTFLRGMSNILQAVMDDTKGGTIKARVIDQTVSGLLPAAGAMRDLRNLHDPTLRNPEGLTEQIKASLPILSEQVEPRVDFTGKEIPRPNTILPEKKAADPIRAELIRLFGEGIKTDESGGYYRDPAKAADGLLKKINGKLREVQRPRIESIPKPLLTKYAKAYGQESERQLRQLVTDSEYLRLDDSKRRELIERVKSKITAAVDRRFVGEYLQAGQP
jgi:hypothetical protein